MADKMKALVFKKYGDADVLEFEKREKPVVKEGCVLIKVKATGLNAADWRIMKAKPFLARIHSGLFKPAYNKQILGCDIAGIVEETGKNIAAFKKGDEVIGDIALSGMGGLAEYVCAPEKYLALKPKGISFEQGAAMPMGILTAFRSLRGLNSGMSLLIYGASGGVGTFMIQLAKYLGARVTAVCSGGKVEIARSLGADRIIDYTKENFAETKDKYDMVIAANGYSPLRTYLSVLKSKGVCKMSGGNTKQIFESLLLAPLYSLFSDKKAGIVEAVPNMEDLPYLSELVGTGRIKVVMDKVFDFNDAIEAMRYMVEGHAKGKVVIRIQK